MFAYFQLREFVGLTCFHLPFESYASFRTEEDGMLDMARNIATKQVIAEIESW